MTAKVFAIIVAAMALALSAHAQAMGEYGSVATQASKVLSAPTAPNPTRGITTSETTSTQQPGEKASKPAPVKGPVVWEAKNTQVKGQAAPVPALPAVFILSNGQKVESGDYFITMDSVSLQEDGKERVIPLSSLNVSATVAANHDRGLDLKFPDNKAQITISF
jgi:hypothetical protein